jgi:hypothetical protein
MDMTETNHETREKSLMSTQPTKQESKVNAALSQVAAADSTGAAGRPSEAPTTKWGQLTVVLLVLLGGAFGAFVSREVFLDVSPERVARAQGTLEDAVIEVLAKQREADSAAEAERDAGSDVAKLEVARKHTRDALASLDLSKLQEKRAMTAHQSARYPLELWQALLAGATAAGLGIFVVAGAAIASAGGTFTPRPELRSLPTTFFFAVLVGLSGVTYLRVMKADFEKKLEKGQEVSDSTSKVERKGDALALTVQAANQAPPTGTSDARKEVNDAVKTAGNEAVALTQKVQEVAGSSPEVARAGEESVSKMVDKLSEAASVAPIQAAKQVENIAQAAQRANLTAVEQKARDTLVTLKNKPEYIVESVRAQVARLVKTEQSERNSVISAVATLGQPAVKPVLEEVKRLQGIDTPLANGVRAGAAAVLTRMKQPITLDTEDAAVIVTLFESAERQTRADAAEFLMDLSDGASIRAVYTSLEPIIREPGQPSGQNGSKVYNTALVLATWARNLRDSIKAPAPNGQADPMKSMSSFALEKAKELRTLLATRDAKGWRETISMLDELIQKAPPQTQLNQRSRTGG